MEGVGLGFLIGLCAIGAGIIGCMLGGAVVEFFTPLY